MTTPSLRVLLAHKQLRFVFSFFGLVDLLSILSTFPRVLTSGRSAPFRLLRLVPVLKLVRYNAAIQSFRRAPSIAKEDLVLFGFLAIVAMFLRSVGIWYFEREAQPEDFALVPHSMWWAMVSLTMVGYGKVVPITSPVWC